VDRALDAIARIAAAVDLPVTADIESGYAAGPSGVAETGRGILTAQTVAALVEAAPAPSTS
jgi:2-methylisocitrate lyase-like PEP mutase family enzyme